jgi:hypothetical protein
MCEHAGRFLTDKALVQERSSKRADRASHGSGLIGVVDVFPSSTIPDDLLWEGMIRQDEILAVIPGRQK